MCWSCRAAEVYGRRHRTMPRRETDPIAPAHALRRSKAGAEVAALEVCRRDGAAAWWARGRFNHTGPGQATQFVLPACRRAAARCQARRAATVHDRQPGDRCATSSTSATWCDAYRPPARPRASRARRTTSSQRRREHRARAVRPDRLRLVGVRVERRAGSVAGRGRVDMPVPGRQIRRKLRRATGWAPTRSLRADVFEDLVDAQAD